MEDNLTFAMTNFVKKKIFADNNVFAQDKFFSFFAQWRIHVMFDYTWILT